VEVPQRVERTRAVILHQQQPVVTSPRASDKHLGLYTWGQSGAVTNDDASR